MRTIGMFCNMEVSYWASSSSSSSSHSPSSSSSSTTTSSPSSRVSCSATWRATGGTWSSVKQSGLGSCPRWSSLCWGQIPIQRHIQTQTQICGAVSSGMGLVHALGDHHGVYMQKLNVIGSGTGVFRIRRPLIIIAFVMILTVKITSYDDHRQCQRSAATWLLKTGSGASVRPQLVFVTHSYVAEI